MREIRGAARNVKIGAQGTDARERHRRMVKDYYNVLGVEHDAPEAVIKAAYRRLARAHHPDLAPERRTAEVRIAGLKMREINEAYAAVRSDQRRRRVQTEFGSAADRAPDDTSRDEFAQPPDGDAEGKGASASRDRSRDPTRSTRLANISGAVVEGLVSGFLEKLGQRMQQEHAGLKLAPAHIEGFKLGFRGKRDGVRYTVAIHGLSQLDVTSAAEFVRSATAIVERDRSALRQSVFIFMLAYGGVDQLEPVVRAITRLPGAAKRNQSKDECVVALVPSLGGQAVVFGNAVKTVEPLRAVMTSLLPGAAVH